MIDVTKKPLPVLPLLAVIISFAGCWNDSKINLPAESVVESAPSTRTFSGRIVDHGGLPVRGAYVAAAGADLWRNGVKTDQEGRFTLSDIPANVASVVAFSQHRNRMALIDVKQAAPADGRYTLDCDATSVSGRVLDSRGYAVEGASVVLHVSSPQGISYIEPGEKTNRYGEWFASPVPAAQGCVVHAVLQSSHVATLTAETAGSVNIQLPDLIQGSPAGAEALVARNPVRHSGRVVDADGQPIGDVTVELNFVDDAGWSGANCITDADGRWTYLLPARIDDVQVRLSHSDFVGYTLNSDEPSPAMHTLRDGTAVQIMPRGLRVRGRVLDESGQPVSNAVVRAGDGASYAEGLIEDCTMVRTGRDGSFTLGGIPAGRQTVSVVADGFVDAYVSATVTPDMQPVDFVLDRGRTVTGRIVDDAGQPLENVRIQGNDWNVPHEFRRHLELHARSGKDGRFALANVPREGVIITYLDARDRMGTGFEIVPGVDDVGDVPVYSRPVFEGKVVDCDTGRPVEKFSIITGWMKEDGKFRPLERGNPAERAGGVFQQPHDGLFFRRQDQIRFAIKIAATGYAAKLSSLVAPGETIPPQVIELKKTATLAGRIVAPDGRPAAETQLYLVGPENDLIVMGSRINEHLTFAPELRAAAATDGSFEMASLDEAGQILALHDSGCAIVSTEEFEMGQTISLKAWARIEGTYLASTGSNYPHDSRPRDGVSVSASPIVSSSTNRNNHEIEFQLTTTTDANGRFIIEHVPAMPLNVQAMASFGPAVSKLIEIEPGTMATVSLGDDGPTAVGRVNLQSVVAANPSDRGTRFDTSTSWVRAVRVEPRPVPPAGVDVQDWDAQIQSALDGQPSKRLTIPTAFADLQNDGAFAFAALGPGRYKLFVEVHGERPPETCGWGLLLAKGQGEFEVADVPVVIPEVQLQATTHPSVGSDAPEVAGKLPSGHALSLEAHRGKPVVLDFWAGWCAPCRASQPALKALHTKYSGLVEFVGLNFDYNSARAREAIDSIQTPWQHVLCGAWDANNPTLVAYGVEVIPSIWLIDAQGKVLARDLTPDELDNELMKLPK